MNKRLYKFICFLFVVFLRCSVYAQLNFSIQKIDMPKPFSKAFIRNVCRDRLGFIYFTTNQGIWRYDGTDVQAFNIKGITLPPAPLVSLLYCYEQFVFFAFKNDPDLLYCYDNQILQLRKYRIMGISKFAPDPKSRRLILFTRDGEAFSFEKKTGLKKTFRLKTAYATKDYTEPDQYFFDTDGRLFLLFRTTVAQVVNGIIRFGKPGATSVVEKKNAPPPYDLNTTYINDAFCTSKYMVARYSQGFAIYDKATLKKEFEYHNDDDYVYTFAVKDTVVVVFRGRSKGLKLPAAACFKALANIEPYSAIKRIWPFKALGGGFIAATNDHLFLISEQNTMSKDTSFRHKAMGFFYKKSIRGIYKDGGRYYVGTYNGFYVFDGRGRATIPIITYAIQRSARDQLLIGVEGGDGFATLNMRNNLISFLPNPGHNNLGVTKLLRYGNDFIGAVRSSLYIVSKNAQMQWRHRLWITDQRIGIIKDIVYTGNHFWVAGEGGLFRLDGNRFTRVTIGSVNDNPVYAILPTNGGILLATLGQGIVKIDNDGNLLWRFTFTDGLTGDFVYSLTEVDGLLFAGTSGGLSVLDLKSMQVLPNPNDSKFDDLYAQEFNHSAVYYDAENRQLIMGGLQGLLFLDVDYYRSLSGSLTEKLILSYVKESSNSIVPPQIDLFADARQIINIKPEETLVALKFAGSFKQKDMLFRIKEISLNWRKSSLFNEISLYALPPGTYTLQARFPSSTDPKYWLVKTLVVRPFFYQTLIFKGVMIIVVLLLIYLLWLSRIKKLKHEMELRTSIASDLHDEIGSTLTRISLSSELMFTRQETNQDIIQNISNESKNAIASISDIIWSVDARNDNREDLILRIHEHVHFMLSDTADFTFETIGLEKVRALPQRLRQNIYLIFKEAINNIVRHNICPYVWISLNNGPLEMKITIKNTIDRKPGAGHSGQGLKNMKMRAERIKASLSIEHSDKYFVVTIKTRRW